MFKTSNASVLDGLFDISKPVESEQYGGHVGVSAASTTHAHANPSSDYVGQDGGNSTQVADVGSDEPKPPSFAKIVQDHKEVVKVNFRKMETEDKMEGVDVVIPVASVKQDSSCPKKPKAVVDDGSKNEVDGFREVRGKNKKGNQQGFQNGSGNLR
ncbi:hypothetical protein L1987_80520 [Smallanthus sonchifolius]|uniref:Uncharacterized protein n=1 Tax=Smallanthus sonchifolius TaxID=185202 RepID=A0ACB8YNZ4_9ASTR|nr:hypothetical protein L1987_80520 [Smallanthus sonchifolius]